jgi:hypothetical protein
MDATVITSNFPEQLGSFTLALFFVSLGVEL